MTASRQCLAALLLSVWGWSSSLLAMDPNEQLLFANGLLRRGLHELAIPEYQALLANAAAAPMHDAAAFRLGECFRQLGRNDEAAAAYDQVLAGPPASSFRHRALFRRAEIDQQQGRLKDAVTRFDELLKSRPSADIEAAALYFSGTAYQQMDRFDDAIRPLRQMVAAYPDSVYTDYARLALEDLLAQNDADPAERTALLLAVADNPAPPELGAEALAKAGHLAYQAQDMATASHRFADLVARYPESPWTARTRLDAGWAHLFADALAPARETVTTGLAAATPDDRPDWLYLAANLERRATNNAAASRHYDDLLTLAPQHPLAPVAAFEAAALAFQAGQPERTLALAALADASGERALPLLWMRASALRSLQHNDAAADLFREIIAAYGTSDRAPSAAYQLALLRSEAGEHAAAAEAFRQVAKDYPASDLAPDALMAAALAHLRANEPERAIAAWNALGKAHPDYPRLDEALIGTARHQAELGKESSAIKTLNRLLDDFPASRHLAEAAYLRGTLHEKADEYEKADELYRRALEAAPAEALTRQIRSRQVAVLQRLDRPQEAAALLNKLIADGGGSDLPSPLLEWLARWNLEQQAYAEAGIAARLLALGATEPGWRQLGHYIAGIAARELGQSAEATTAFAAAADIPLNSREGALALYELGQLATARQDDTAAIRHYTAAAERAAADALMDIRARSYLQLGVTHERLGQPAEALRHYLIVGVLYDDPTVTPESLFRAAGAQDTLQQQRQLVQTLAELRSRYPDTPWTQQANDRWPPAGKEQP